jgi:callose synthase
MPSDLLQKSVQTEKEEAAMFAPFWNEIINCLREEDYITNRYLAFGQILLI